MEELLKQEVDLATMDAAISPRMGNASGSGSVQKEQDPTDKEGEKTPAPQKSKTKRPSYHVRLDATLLDEKEVHVPNQDRMVFVDNLPIDISETDLFDLYGRCGPLQSVQIFNQRLDLDPGPLSGGDLRTRNKHNRKKRMSSTTTTTFQRPKTPLYALLTFATDDAFRVATQDAMLLFGMVVRRHDMRSMRASSLSKLYIENLPRGIGALELENRLGNILKEEGIFVSLDVGYRKRAKPRSCEICFPSFEVAFKSYIVLSAGLESTVPTKEDDIKAFDVAGDNDNDKDDATEDKEEEGKQESNADLPVVVNWMRTPKNAELYWTRELGFE